MTALKEAISVAHRLSSRFPHMPDRLLAVEHAAKRVAQTVADKAATLRAEESDDEFLDRVQNMPIGVVASNPRDMRRLVSVVWSADRRDYTAAAAINAAVEGNRKSFDRAIVSVYLQHFPTHHLDFSHLQAAVSSVADRHDWPWRERGIRWKLWDRSVGPVAVAAELLRADDPREALRSMGFEADLAQGRFAQAAISNVCMEVAITTGEAASRGCTALVSLFSNVGASRDLDPVMARALLRPWQSSSPPEDVRRAITSLIVRRIGDPRIETTRWQLIADELAAGFPSEDPVAVIGVLRRWIVQATVRQFFEVIGRTTSNADQWAQREAFWLAYLDAGYITDAWFAFGPMAASSIRLTQATQRSL